LVELVLTGITLAIIGVFVHSRVSYWKEKASNAISNYDDIMQRAIRAEQEEAKVKDEMARWQQMLVAMNNRPIIATLSDQQAQMLIQAVQMFMSSNKAGAN
jgi:hypothetical protein